MSLSLKLHLIWSHSNFSSEAYIPRTDFCNTPHDSTIFRLSGSIFSFHFFWGNVLGPSIILSIRALLNVIQTAFHKPTNLFFFIIIAILTTMSSELNHPQLGTVKGAYISPTVVQYRGIQYATIPERFEDALLNLDVPKNPDASIWGYVILVTRSIRSILTAH